MKKSCDYKVKSSVRCSGCGKALKQNLVDKNPKADRCYRCYKGTPGRVADAGLCGAQEVEKN